MLQELEPAPNVTQAKKNVAQAITQVAARLGNTPAVCRKCYVHPAVLEAYLDDLSLQAARKQLDREISAHAAALRREEQALLDLLQQRVALEAAA